MGEFPPVRITFLVFLYSLKNSFKEIFASKKVGTEPFPPIDSFLSMWWANESLGNFEGKRKRDFYQRQ